MSRRSNRKTAAQPSYNEDESDILVAAPSTPSKRGRKSNDSGAVKNEDLESIRPKSATKKVAKKVAKTNNKAKTEVERGAGFEAESTTEPSKKNTLKKQTTQIETEEIIIEKSPQKETTTKRKIELDEGSITVQTEKKVKKPRKTKEEKEEVMLPLAARTAVNGLSKAMYIGAHVSAAGGVDKSINNALHIGGNAFALFLKSQRKWVSPPMASEARDQFRKFCEDQKFDAAKHVLPHGSYLVNLAAKDKEKADQAYDCFLDDLNRCEALGIRLYNFHPGNTNGNPRPEAIGRIAAQLNKAHKATNTVATVLENMAGTGNTIGSTFEDLRDIIALVDDKKRVGVCIDTCHSFAAGYDLRSPEAFEKTMNKFKEVVGIEYLCAVHLNDSKAPFESHRDLHANIGTGFLGLRAFHNIVNSPLFQNMPMVLETPIDKKGADGKTVEDKSVWATEIKLLEGLVGADPDSEAFRSDEKRLWEDGVGERAKFQAQADKKAEKGQKTLDGMFSKGKAKGGKKKKKAAPDDDASDDDSGCSH